MLSDDELLSLVRDTDKRESWRREALDRLVENLAVDHLHKVVLDTNRNDDWRKYSLDAICEISTLQENTSRKDSWPDEAMKALIRG